MDLEKSVLAFHNSAADGHNNFRLIFRAGILGIFLLCLIYLFPPSIFSYLDYRIYDVFLQSASPVPGARQIVIVDIDEQSLRKYGQWPWPRYRIAELLSKINGHVPASVTLDIIFSEPDRTSIGPLIKRLSEDFSLDITAGNIPATILDNDKILGDALKQGPFVLATKFHFGESIEISENCQLHPVTTVSLHDRTSNLEPDLLFRAKSVLCNLPELTRTTDHTGFFNINPDRDGILRRVPLLIRYQDKIYPSLALATLLKNAGTNQLLMSFSGSRLESISFQKKNIPVDRNGQMLINFRGPQGQYRYISAADVMEESVTSKALQGKMVFVGTSAAGLKELRATPFDPTFPGVEVHAGVVDTILAGDFIVTYNWITGLIFMLIILFGLISTLILSRVGAHWGLIFVVAGIAFLWFGAGWSFHNKGVYFPLSYLIFSILIVYLLLTVLKYRLEEVKVLARTKELLLTQDTAIESMATLAEYRDPDTGGHIKRTREYLKILAEKLQEKPKFEELLNDSVIEMLYKSAPLHDIGKVGVPDHILLKTGSLTEQEFEIMKRHTLIGRDVIRTAETNLGRDSFLKYAGEMAYTHQEKWDGTGYPRGLKGSDIPVSGRLMALVDIYDALISKRAYKKPCSHQEAVRSIKLAGGTYLDPEIVGAFLEVEGQFKQIACKYADSEEERLMLEQ